MAMALAGTAGFVDAFIYVRVTPVFVANMSGNLVRLGVAAGQHDGSAVVLALVSLVGFSTGAAVATSTLDQRLRRGRPPSPAPLLLVESALLTALVVFLALDGSGFSRSLGAAKIPIIVLGATAMGIQAVALRRVGQIAVLTTYGTGAVVRLSEKIALAARHADRPTTGRRRATIAVLGGVLVSYIAGAYLGTSVGSSPAWLLVPAAVPACGALLLRRRAGIAT